MMFIALATSCNPEEKYPKDISFTEYSLDETLCQWANLPYNSKVIIINSKDELKKYLEGNISDLPAIDFSKQSLLLASGKTEKGVPEISVNRLLLNSSDNALLSIDIGVNNIDDGNSWCVAIVIDKIKSLRNVELEIILKDIVIEYPIDIPFERFVVTGNHLQALKLSYNDFNDFCYYEGIWSIIGEYCFKYHFDIIDNYEQLDNILKDIDKYPEIDFRKQTLLLAPLIFFTGVGSIERQFQQISESEYLFLLHIDVNETATMKDWTEAILVPKLLPQNANIKLKVIIK